MNESKLKLQRLREGYLERLYPEKCLGPQQIVLKLTNACNLRCIYCYSNAGIHKDIQYISADMVIDFFDQYFQECRNSVVNCTFHGGEPLLNFPLICEITSKLKQKYYYPRIRFSIQTNATLITEDKIEFLKEHFDGVGVSFDGIGEVQGLTRSKSTGENSFEDFAKGIALLKSHNIHCGALLVMTKYNKDHLIETLNWCVHNGIYGMGIEMVFPGGRGAERRELAFSPEEYFEIMKEALYWQIGYNQKNDRPFYIRDFETIAKKIVYSTDGHMCACVPCGAGKDEISLDFNGNVYVCDSFDGKSEYIMGNIKTESLSKILGAPIVRKFTERKLNMINECRDCKQNTICIIGCPVRNLIDKDENGLFDRNYMCGYYKKISKLLYDLLVIKKLDPSLFTRSNGRHVNYQIIDFSNEENME